MFNTILAATDGSDHARKAVRVAAELAALCRAKLVVVLAVPAGEPSAELRRMAEVEEGDLGELLKPWIRPALIVGIGLAAAQQVTGTLGSPEATQEKERAEKKADLAEQVFHRRFLFLLEPEPA